MRRNGNRSLLDITGDALPHQPHLPRCPYTTGLRPWSLRRPVADEEVESLPRRMPGVRKSTPCLRTASTRTERRVIVVGDSLLRGTEGPICWPDPTRRGNETFVARKLPNLVHSSDYYALLIVQSGSDDTEERSLKTIKRDFTGLGQLVDGAGVQVVFSSIPMVAGRSIERTRKAHLINT